MRSLTTVVPALLALFAAAGPLMAYPPAVSILGPSRNSLTCHVNNGPWSDETKTIVDVLDKDTGQSLKQAEGSFLIEAKRGQAKTVITVIGRSKDDTAPAPRRNAWLYQDPTQRETGSLSKFAPGWSVNLPMSCRLVGDAPKGFEGAKVTALPMTLRPGDDARDAELELQVMLTSGEAVKGSATDGMLGNYFERRVRLRVIE